MTKNQWCPTKIKKRRYSLTVSLQSCKLVFGKNFYNMDKRSEIKFVGQPIFKQVVNLVQKVNISALIKAHESDRYYKAFKSRTHLITMLFGILSRCDSMTETCEGPRALGGKLNHLGLEKAPSKSTASDGLRNRDNRFFESLYFALVDRYKSFLSDSRTFGLTFKEVLLVDSTTHTCKNVTLHESYFKLTPPSPVIVFNDILM
jgi:hypothetical protein